MVPSAGSIHHFSGVSGASSQLCREPCSSWQSQGQACSALAAHCQLCSLITRKCQKPHSPSKKIIMRKCCFEYRNTRVDEKKSRRRNLSPLCNYFWNLIGPPHLSVYTSVSSKIAFLLPLHDFMIYCLVTDNHYQ